MGNVLHTRNKAGELDRAFQDAGLLSTGETGYQEALFPMPLLAA